MSQQDMYTMCRALVSQQQVAWVAYSILNFQIITSNNINQLCTYVFNGGMRLGVHTPRQVPETDCSMKKPQRTTSGNQFRLRQVLVQLPNRIHEKGLVHKHLIYMYI